MKLLSDKLKDLAMRSTLPLLLLVVAGCASTPVIVTVPSACSSLIPSGIRADVAGVEPYGASPTVGDLVAFGDGQTAALETANRNKADGFEIVARCEARDAASAEALKPGPWWRPF